MVKEKKLKVEKKEEKKKTVKENKKTEKKVKKVKEKPLTTFKSEISKIKWPGKKEMVKYSIATIVFVIFFGIFFYAIELLMALLKSII